MFQVKPRVAVFELLLRIPSKILCQSKKEEITNEHVMAFLQIERAFVDGFKSGFPLICTLSSLSPPMIAKARALFSAAEYFCMATAWNFRDSRQPGLLNLSPFSQLLQGVGSRSI